MSRGEDEVQGEGHSRHIHSLTVQSSEERKRLCDPRSRRSLAASLKPGMRIASPHGGVVIRINVNTKVSKPGVHFAYSTFILNNTRTRTSKRKLTSSGASYSQFGCTRRDCDIAMGVLSIRPSIDIGGVLFDNSASHSSPSFPIGYCSQSASNFRPSFLVSLLKRRHC